MLFCLFGIVWLFFIQTSPGDGSPNAAKLNGSDFALGVLVEAQGVDEFGAPLEDSVELSRVGLDEISIRDNPTSLALTGASDNARRARPDLSPPLVV
jgi:hypothetical protein